MEQWRRSGFPGAGIVVAACLLALIEGWMHTDGFLYKYRSVFAAGRAMDKVRYIEAANPEVLIVGNSRVDNGFNPVIVQRALGFKERSVFNLGVPGANARVMHGIFRRLASRHLFGKNAVSTVVMCLDESFFQAEDSLGYSVFFVDWLSSLEEGAFADAFASLCRLWGYADNLKQLREPSKLFRFFEATWQEVEPLGGAASDHYGYRAGFTGGFQDADQVATQEAASQVAPDAGTETHFWKMLDLLHEHGVRVAVVFPPLLHRDVLFAVPDNASAPYREIAHGLERRNIPLIYLDEVGARTPDDFANAGHLNDRGAQRYTELLARRLKAIWPNLSMAALQ